LYHTLIQQQSRIGWRQLFNGRISTEWARLQDDYLTDRGIRTAKKTGSLWWTIGINNQFRLKFIQQSVTDSLSGASMADSRVMTSSARFYQPQFRLGLMYNHNGKVHWQLQPLFQYTLTEVYASGGSDNTILTNLQLQYRLFLQGKNKGKKSSK
jgi:hypothetical protein